MVYRTLPEHEYKDLESRILYEDNHILAVNKKVGIQGAGAPERHVQRRQCPQDLLGTGMQQA